MFPPSSHGPRSHDFHSPCFYYFFCIPILEETSEDLEKLIDSTNLAASDVRNKLKEMDQDIKKASKQEKGTAQYR